MAGEQESRKREERMDGNVDEMVRAMLEWQSMTRIQYGRERVRGITELNLDPALAIPRRFMHGMPCFRRYVHCISLEVASWLMLEG